MKSYFKILRQYEIEKKQLNLLIDYLCSSETQTTKSFCEGEYYLPSFILIKKLQSHFQDLCHIDRELNSLFENSIICSKLFYLGLINIIKPSSSLEQSTAKFFERKFEKELEPLGQRLINLLVSIKYRVKLTKINYSRLEQSQKNNPLKMVQESYEKIYNILYKTILVISSYHGLGKKIYYVLTALLISTIWALNFLIFYNISPIISTIFNIMSAITILLFSIANYPLWDFGKIDISGKNIVAYRYRLFFNNRARNEHYNPPPII